MSSQPRGAGYAEMSALSRGLLRILRRPVWVEVGDWAAAEAPHKGIWSLDQGAPLLSLGAEKAWTEHSERCTCPGWAAAAGVPRDDRGYLGRWADGNKASSSDEYVRTAR